MPAQVLIVYLGGLLDDVAKLQKISHRRDYTGEYWRTIRQLCQLPESQGLDRHHYEKNETLGCLEMHLLVATQPGIHYFQPCTHS